MKPIKKIISEKNKKKIYLSSPPKILFKSAK